MSKKNAHSSEKRTFVRLIALVLTILLAGSAITAAAFSVMGYWF
ncbi:hypothetical protein ACH6CV_11795 [Bacillota bacterium Meth-B3]|nr:hypothetical protein [Christensenellaceae bacterium]MEA5064958.1 hypothetical protein [Eubacteriales bacterium]MEA5069107.1 hypothetical protein [Christensenellaceae bacterium]